ncbi:MAG: response regulator [Candidatus Cloacimonetes bacterium]|nr:response regulator [Candidatus Cloacimonadota bacterium]
MDSKHHRVLLIDGDRESINLMQSRLQKVGYVVHDCASTEQALRLIDNKPFDVIICDIDMPNINGLEMLERIKKTAQIPVILVTQTIRTEDALKAIRLGAADFFGKPIDIKAMLRSIRANTAPYTEKLENQRLSNYLSDVSFSYQLNVDDFFQEELAITFLNFLKRTYPLPPSTINVLQMCLDEMIQNAFLHGIFCLSQEQRSLPQKQYRALVSRMMCDKEKHNHQVKIQVNLIHGERMVRVSVEDTGEGFDYTPFIRKQTPEIHFEGTGRGLLFISQLTDSMYFEKNGKRIIIEKHFNSQ